MMEVFTVGMKRRVEGTQTPLIQQQFERGKYAVRVIPSIGR